jgi:hypothetical protein
LLTAILTRVESTAIYIVLAVDLEGKADGVGCTERMKQEHDPIGRMY